MYYTCKQQNEHRYLAKPFLLKRQAGFRRFHAHSCTIMCSRCAGFPSKYATVLTVFYRSCQQMHRDVQLRSIRESVKYCLCALQLSGSNVQSAILAPLSRKFAGRAEIIKTGLRGCAFPLPSHKLVKASVDTLKHIPVYTRARTHTRTLVYATNAILSIYVTSFPPRCILKSPANVASPLTLETSLAT